MAYTIMIPQPGKAMSVKDAIISILVAEQPLSARKIFNKVKKDHALNVTYQAVYKAMAQLAEEGVLSKKELEYSLNTEWIKTISNFVDKVKTAYSAGTQPSLFGLSEFKQQGDMQTYVFENLGKAEEYRKNLQVELFNFYKGSTVYCGQSKHLKSPVIYSEKSINILKTVNNFRIKCFIVVSGDSPIDKWCADFYKKQGVRVKTGIKVADNCDTMVIGEFVTQLYIPEELAKEIEKTYEMSDISKIDVTQFYQKVFERKIPIKFTILRNSEIAGQLRKQTMAYFNDSLNLFDIDGTLVKGYSIFEFIKFLYEQETISKKSFDEVKKTISSYEAKKVSYKEFVVQIVSKYAEALKGKQFAEIMDKGKEFVNSGRLNFYPYVIELLFDLNLRGRLVGISGSPIEIISAVRDYIGFDAVIATELEVKDGIYTGNVKINMALKENKEAALKNYLAENNLSLGNSMAFGDTAEDLSLLEKAKIAVAMNPNDELREIAKKKGWKMLSEKDNISEEIKKLI